MSIYGSKQIKESKVSDWRGAVRVPRAQHGVHESLLGLDSKIWPIRARAGQLYTPSAPPPSFQSRRDSINSRARLLPKPCQ